MNESDILAQLLSDSDDSTADPNYVANETEESSSSGEDNASAENLGRDSTTEETLPSENRQVSLRKVTDPSKWKKNIRKAKRLAGEAYITSKGKMKQGKEIKPSPCSANSKHKCTQNVPEAARMQIFQSFYSLKSLQEQRNFITLHVKEKEVKRRTAEPTTSRRQRTLEFYLTKDKIMLSVCKRFFLATLDTTDAMVRGSIAMKNSSGIVEYDKRGCHTPVNKTPQEVAKSVEDHIKSFPMMESHYCRKNSKNLYLSSDLTITKMHQFYNEMQSSSNKKLVTYDYYARIFRTMNLSFHIPKKDACKKCTKFENLTTAEKENYKEEQEIHINRKQLAREERDRDKSRAKVDNRFLGCNFDLQAVLTTPKATAGIIYYKRKLAVYNFTVYDLGNSSGNCFVWDETNGKRGANEISTCLFKYLMSHNEISFCSMMSDTCGGQNRNTTVAAMCMYTLQKHPTLQTIDHKFFESGHSQMECDSMHSKIEQRSRKTTVFTTNEWETIIKMSRERPSPFKTQCLLFDDFLNFKDLVHPQLAKIPWMKTCWIRYSKESSKLVQFKLSYEEDFKNVELKSTRTVGRAQLEDVKNAYDSRLPITKAKYNDLQSLCEDLVIPKSCHQFYKDLPAIENQIDRLPAPDVLEEDGELQLE